MKTANKIRADEYKGSLERQIVCLVENESVRKIFEKLTGLNSSSSLLVMDSYAGGKDKFVSIKDRATDIRLPALPAAYFDVCPDW